MYSKNNDFCPATNTYLDNKNYELAIFAVQIHSAVARIIISGHLNYTTNAVATDTSKNGVIQLSTTRMQVLNGQRHV